jgi:hypothetical protein
MQTKIRTGVWTALGGSTFKIIVKNNRVIGTYSTTHGRPEKDQLFFTTGLINEGLIGLTVAWENFSSLTTWCGRHEIIDNRECIKSMFYYGRMFEDNDNKIPLEIYRAFSVGQSVFFWERNIMPDEEQIIHNLGGH